MSPSEDIAEKADRYALKLDCWKVNATSPSGDIAGKSGAELSTPKLSTLQLIPFSPAHIAPAISSHAPVLSQHVKGNTDRAETDGQ